jgi:2-polyprenyl-3-methyl-5-hydroxy-6-metoxy-1,4-benzoquinol methylase
VTTTIPYRQAVLEFAAALSTIGPRSAGAAPLRLFDFGYGYGVMLQILASRDMESVGCEPSTERGRQTTADGRFPVLTSLGQLATGGPFDLFVCAEVLEHLPDPREVLHLFKVLAAPGALLALTVPQCEPAMVAHAFATLAVERRLAAVFNPWEHLNYFSAASLRRLLAEEGFGIVRDYGVAEGVREAAAHVGEPAALKACVRNGARLLKRAAFAAPSAQLFCRSLWVA